jgi:hypothetical protein
MPSSTRGFSVRIYIPTGEPEGLRIVEKSNWIGQGIVFPRSQFPEAKRREELRRIGVYILWSTGESGKLPIAYVGEGDSVLLRLEQHARAKDFWTHAAVFSSKDQNLNKAHVQYIESRLISLADQAKRCDLNNSNAAQTPSLSDADLADAESFLADVLLCLPVIGVNFFEKPTISSSKSRDLLLRGKGIEARGIDSPEGFVVRSGARAVKVETRSIDAGSSELRRVLKEKGVLRDAGEALLLTQDYAFSSPSTASDVLLGRSSNGRIECKDASGRTLKEIQDSEAKA